MNSARFAFRRPVFRCLNAPAPFRPRPQFRKASRRPIPKSRAEAESILAQRSQQRGGQPKANLDNVSLHRAEVMRRAAYTKKRNGLALGAALSMIAPIILVQLWDLPAGNKESSEGEDQKKGVLDAMTSKPIKADSPRAAISEFQGKKVVVAAGDKIIAAPENVNNPQASDVGAIELVETGTSYVPYFPKTIKLPTSSASDDIQSEAEYTLLGLGIRRVSFLSIQVYVVGLYVKNSSLSTLQNQLINTVNPTASALIPGEKDELRNALVDPEKSNQIWESILAKENTSGVEMAIRVVPVRGTDFGHLRDGWMRGIASRTDETKRKHQDLIRQQAAESKQIALPKPVQQNEFADESFGLAMKDFKNLFASRGKAPKGSVIIMQRDKAGALSAYYQTITTNNHGVESAGKLKTLGQVQDDRVSRLVWLLYLGGKTVSSEEARKSIVDGCIQLAERPVGTAEGMVQ